MSFIQSILMGLIQGLTEFLPVSSSGHLAIFKNLFHVNMETGLLFDVLLHIGTLIAVCVVYFRDIKELIVEAVKMLIDIFGNLAIKLSGSKKSYRKIISNSYRKFVVLVIVATIPTGIIGMAFNDLIEKASTSLLLPGVCLLITAALLFISDRAPDGSKRPKQVTYKNAVVIGIAQGIATLPGISRSGTTITACVLSGFDRKFAVKYSFILSIPAILGALVLQLKDIGSVQITSMEVGSYVVGMIVAAVVGYICIKAMLVIVGNKKFTYFSIYCLIIGVISIIGYFVMA